jgi:hypothetical protein
MSGTLCDANRMYTQIPLSSKIYIIHLIYIVYIYNINLYVEYVRYIHTIIDRNYGTVIQRSECP